MSLEKGEKGCLQLLVSLLTRVFVLVVTHPDGTGCSIDWSRRKSMVECTSAPTKSSTFSSQYDANIHTRVVRWRALELQSIRRLLAVFETSRGGHATASPRWTWMGIRTNTRRGTVRCSRAPPCFWSSFLAEGRTRDNKAPAMGGFACWKLCTLLWWWIVWVHRRMGKCAHDGALFAANRHLVTSYGYGGHVSAPLKVETSQQTWSPKALNAEHTEHENPDTRPMEQ